VCSFGNIRIHTKEDITRHNSKQFPRMHVPWPVTAWFLQNIPLLLDTPQYTPQYSNGMAPACGEQQQCWVSMTCWGTSD